VLGIVLAIVVAYLVVMGGVVLLHSWLWLRDRRAASVKHRRSRTSPGGIAVSGGGSRK
jgi:hypothetical protein